MTDDNMVPEWMKQEQKKEEAQEAAQRDFEQRALAAHLILDREGPKFWQSLKEKLQISVESLHYLKLAGSFGSPLGDPRHVHIEVTRQDHFPLVSNTDVYFDGDFLRCSGLNVGSYQAKLIVMLNNEVVASIDPPKTMNPDGTAQYIMRRMVDAVKTGRH